METSTKTHFDMDFRSISQDIFGRGSDVHRYSKGLTKTAKAAGPMTELLFESEGEANAVMPFTTSVNMDDMDGKEFIKMLFPYSEPFSIRHEHTTRQ